MKSLKLTRVAKSTALLSIGALFASNTLAADLTSIDARELARHLIQPVIAPPAATIQEQSAVDAHLQAMALIVKGTASVAPHPLTTYSGADASIDDTHEQAVNLISTGSASRAHFRHAENHSPKPQLVRREAGPE